ncbi:hypothetical protein DPMN_040370 [Dreissena polymorpha]|uniref:Uncharacterized protein n=1 Tax=Dreissena polymorpha TaxID=45954 RepID=A0A9D4HWT6_DREPO|nr:hypothetical protein DPMN_040370 [Dreissena polymorpha]
MENRIGFFVSGQPAESSSDSTDEDGNVERVIQFICNYADEFGIQQPATPRGRDDTAPIYLHSGATKMNIHKLYKASSPFSQFGDDVCATCEELRKKIMDSVSEEDKLASTAEIHSHIVIGQKKETSTTCTDIDDDDNDGGKDDDDGNNGDVDDDEDDDHEVNDYW